MNSQLLHTDALDALLTVVTSPKRWRTRAALASDMGCSPSVLSNATRAGRMSEATSQTLADLLGVDECAWWVPRPGLPHDLRVDEELKAIKRLSDEASELVHAISDLHTAITERTKHLGD